MSRTIEVIRWLCVLSLGFYLVGGIAIIRKRNRLAKSSRWAKIWIWTCVGFAMNALITQLILLESRAGFEYRVVLFPILLGLGCFALWKELYDQ